MTRKILPSAHIGQVSSDGVAVTASEDAQARVPLPHGKRGATAVAALLGSVLVALPAGPGGAQAFPLGAAKWRSVTDAGTARLLLAAAEVFKVEDVAGASGAPVPLKIHLPPNPTVSYSFLMVRNLPPNFTLSSGFAAKDYWAVSLHDLEGLQMIAPEDYEGSFTMEVLLVKGVGADPERRTAKVVLKSKASAAAGASVNDDTKLLTATRPEDSTSSLPLLNPPRQPVELTDIDQSMMERGNIYLKQGDIAAARLLFRKLAKKGIADGALAMANTYDPEFLSTLAVRGLQPDIVQAKNWYRMAQELGSPQAAQRLATLNAKGN